MGVQKSNFCSFFTPLYMFLRVGLYRIKSELFAELLQLSLSLFASNTTRLAFRRLAPHTITGIHTGLLLALPL